MASKHLFITIERILELKFEIAEGVTLDYK